MMKKWIANLLCFCMFTSLCACTLNGEKSGSDVNSSNEYNSSEQSISESIRQEESERESESSSDNQSDLPEYTLSVSVDSTNLISEMARTYLASSANTNISDIIATGAGRSDLGLATIFEHTSTAGLANGTVTIKEVGAVDGITVTLKNKKTNVYNLKTATEYEYHLVATTVYNGIMEETGRFTTEDTVRFLNVQNIVNARDIGNRKTEAGKTIKQGLLYRGSELDGLVETAYCLTDAGKRVMLEELNVRTLLDLRNPDKTAKDGGTLKAKDGTDRPSPLGESTTRIFFNMAQYDGVFSTEGKEKTRLVFTELANKDNYPAYLHCTYGCDRTGTVGLLLDGLLGCSKETALRGYEMSALYKDFPHINRENAGIISFFSRLNALYSSAGESYAERVEAYLLDCGVTVEQIENIREIFLGAE